MLSCQENRLPFPRRRALFPSLLLGSLLPLFAVGMANAQSKVIGYIPSYQHMPTVVDRTDLSKLTHINIAFVNPDASGTLTSSGEILCMDGGKAADIRYLVNKAHQAGVKVLVSLAGGVLPTCSGDWETLLQPQNRDRLVHNLLQFASNFDLDGLDVDIEGVLLTSIDNAGNYTPFIKALRDGLPAGKLLTAATASYVGGMVPVSSLPYFDFVTLMSYDNVGPSWGEAGAEHSSYETAVAHINIWKARGLSQEKLVLGLPFYGYGFGQYASSYSFNDIINQFGTAAGEKDVIGDPCVGCSYITYNGKSTMSRKVRLALEQGSGVMIWELSQDASGGNSLLSAISDEIKPKAKAKDKDSSQSASALQKSL